MNATACPVCGAESAHVRYTLGDRLYRTTERLFQIAECGACGLLYLYPRPRPEELPDFYPKNYWYAPQANLASRLEEAYRRVVLRDHVHFVRAALEHADESGAILDVGCGGGLFLNLLGERRRPVLGLDFSADAARIAWERNGVRVILGDLEQAPLREGSCAAITMFHVLEHVLAPQAYLDAARQLLGPGGRLIVQVPNASSWQSRLFGARWNGLDVPRHITNFRLGDLTSLLERSGFAVARVKHFSLRDNPAGFATSVAAALDPMARRIRGAKESAAGRLWKDAIYFGLVLAGAPFAVLEAAAGAGSSLMIEARKVA